MTFKAILSTPEEGNPILYWDFLSIMDLSLVALILLQGPAHAWHSGEAHQINKKSTAVLVSTRFLPTV